MDINMIGIDLAKSVFELHGVDAQGSVVLERIQVYMDLLVF